MYRDRLITSFLIYIYIYICMHICIFDDINAINLSQATLPAMNNKYKTQNIQQVKMLLNEGIPLP